jgi:hypothetical protein
MVGSSGSASARFVVVTASARSRALAPVRASSEPPAAVPARRSS